MKREELLDVAKLRILVGYLGEKDQSGWWQSSFFSQSSQAFLVPIFSKTSFLAQYHGVKEAASKIHDDHIGVGKGVYHLFRLPENVEQKLHQMVGEIDLAEQMTHKLVDGPSATAALHAFVASEIDSQEGPIQVGGIKEIEQQKIWGVIAGYYLKAFGEETKVFPYFAETP